MWTAAARWRRSEAMPALPVMSEAQRQERCREQSLGDGTHRFFAEAHGDGLEQRYVVRQEFFVVKRELRGPGFGLNEAIDVVLREKHVERPWVVHILEQDAYPLDHLPRVTRPGTTQSNNNMERGAERGSSCQGPRRRSHDAPLHGRPKRYANDWHDLPRETPSQACFPGDRQRIYICSNSGRASDAVLRCSTPEPRSDDHPHVKRNALLLG